jgi:hypothetical protein
MLKGFYIEATRVDFTGKPPLSKWLQELSKRYWQAFLLRRTEPIKGGLVQQPVQLFPAVQGFVAWVGSLSKRNLNLMIT